MDDVRERVLIIGLYTRSKSTWGGSRGKFKPVWSISAAPKCVSNGYESRKARTSSALYVVIAWSWLLFPSGLSCLSSPECVQGYSYTTFMIKLYTPSPSVIQLLISSSRASAGVAQPTSQTKPSHRFPVGGLRHTPGDAGQEACSSSSRATSSPWW